MLHDESPEMKDSAVLVIELIIVIRHHLHKQFSMLSDVCHSCNKPAVTEHTLHCVKSMKAIHIEFRLGANFRGPQPLVCVFCCFIWWKFIVDKELSGC